MRTEHLYRVVVTLDVLATDPVDAACAAQVDIEMGTPAATKFLVTPHPGGKTVCVDLGTVPATVRPTDGTACG